MDNEANLPPEGMVESFGEIRQDVCEKFSSERDVVDFFEGWSC
jgi:hypothetical protein